MTRTSQDRITGADLVDFVLYWYAMLHFVKITALEPDLFNGGYGVAITYLLAVTFFTFVLLRNYLVMHAIDTAEHRQDGTFDFLNGNDRIADVLERICRFLIMLTVIVTPKDTYQWAGSTITFLLGQITACMSWLAELADFALPHIYKPTSFVHDALPYYGVVLLLLFAEFLGWDLVNVLALALRLRTRKEALQIDLGRGCISDAEYRSMLIYFNICRRRSNPDEVEQVLFEAPYIENSRKQNNVSQASLVLLYFTSPKFSERLFGLISALLIIGVSVTEFSTLVLFLCTICTTLYAIAARTNDRYFSGMIIGHIKFPISYMRNGSNPFS